MVTLPVIARSAQPFPLTVACPLHIHRWMLKDFEGGCWSLEYWQKYQSVMMMACVVRLSLLEAVHQRAYCATASASLSSWRLRLFQLHCLLIVMETGWWSYLALQLQWSPSLTGDWAIDQCTHWDLMVCCFSWEAEFLNLFCLQAILCLFITENKKNKSW